MSMCSSFNARISIFSIAPGNWSEKPNPLATLLQRSFYFLLFFFSEPLDLLVGIDGHDKRSVARFYIGEESSLDFTPKAIGGTPII